MPHPRRRARTASSVVVATVAVVGLSGCGSSAPSGPPPGKGQLVVSPTTRPSAPTLPQAAPVAQADCPYLDAPTVAALNGEKVLYVRLDTRLDPAACFFYANDERVQLSTLVTDADSPAAAAALVDGAVPVAGSERADLAGGWTGGKLGGDRGAVLAVARGKRVLVVRSAQEQSIKVQRIAEAVAPKL